MSDPTNAASTWLTKFGAALSSGDINAATNMFDEDCYWRDLVTFTWNIKTVEGKAQVKDMLTATLANTKPANWQIDGEATEAGGVNEAWFTFETATARGKGLLRLKGDKCWTLLTSMVELKKFPEKKRRHAYSRRATWHCARSQKLGRTQSTRRSRVGLHQTTVLRDYRRRARWHWPSCTIEAARRTDDSD